MKDRYEECLCLEEGVCEPCYNSMQDYQDVEDAYSRDCEEEEYRDAYENTYNEDSQ